MDAPDNRRTAADAEIERTLKRHVKLFERTEGGWVCCPRLLGCGYAEITIIHDEDRVRTTLDTGIRVPEDRRAEVDTYIRRVNRRLVVPGFEPVDARTGAIVYAFTLSENDVVGLTEAAMAEAVSPEDIVRLLRMRRYSLESCLGRALKAIHFYLPKFNAIAYDGKSAAISAE